ncbi:hemagglutinin repeat-containing protein [Curvivirga aplysinae]|uniref:hemagglutinin repeat-containing protein n=2 Tax=Curvivirga aplysinae TaxID=2529852 RepID=UPI0012BD3CE0|nr:hemagglutinin repeat-containing protein [Curvivirga aplysinae]MTI09937.1 DUF4237 domain-containing protein [Curvivirga aplysinae]
MLFYKYMQKFYYKNNYKYLINLSKKIFTSFVGLSFLAQSIVPSYATDITIDPSSANTSMTTSINGTPVLNIATPTGNGVSHNKFKNFNVSSKNLVVNNSSDAGISKLGGGVLGNANLQKGNEARLILNEVTGATRSQLTGAIELFGSSAPLVLANPNGITCDGCGFINTPRASLITGNVNSNSLHSLNPQFDLSQENVQIGPNGLNFGDATSGEIISRLVELNGDIHGGAVDIVTGYGKYDFQSKSFTEQTIDNATKPSFSIDSTLLGGIYAGRISLVANENGVGVKAPDNMSASLGDMRLTADGQLIVKNLDANGSVYLESKSDNIDLQGTIAAKKNINASAQDITLATTKELAAQENINISGTNLSVNTGSKIVAGGSIDVDTTSDLNNAGVIGATGQLQVTSQDSLTNSGDMTGDTVDVTAHGNFEQSGNIEALTTATINATSTMNMSGNILSLQDFTLNSHQLTMSNTANLKADEDIEIALTQDSTLDGEIVAGENIKVTAQNNLTSNALIQAPNLAFAIGSNFTSKDRIISGSDLTFTNEGSSFTNEGEVVLSGTLSHEGKVTNADGGKIVASDDLSIVVNALENAGDIDATGLTITSADTIENSATGTIDVGANGLTINVVNNLTNAGQVQTEGAFDATAKGLTNSNNLFAARSLNLSLTDAIDNTGTITGDESLTTSFAAAATTPLVTDGQWISSGDLSLTGLSDWTNTGLLMVKGDLIVEATGDVLNSEGSIIALSDLSITGDAGGKANSIVNESGLIQSDDGTITLKADTITNTRKNLVVVDGKVFDKTYHETANSLPNINSVPGASISGAGYAYLTDGSTVVIPHPDRGMAYAAYYDYGSVRVRQYKTELAGGARGTIQSGQNIVIEANTLNNNYSTIAATGDIDISGVDLNNSGLALTSKLYFTGDQSAGFNRCLGGPCKWFDQKGSHLLVETTSAGVEAAIIQAGGNVNLNLTGTLTNNSDVEEGISFLPGVAVTVDSIDKGERAALDYSSIAQGASLAAFNGVEGSLQANPSEPLASVESSNEALFEFLSNSVAGFKSLFGDAAPNEETLYETRFAYADLGQFYGSDYFIDSLPDYTIPADVKRLGDSYMDTRLIHEQIQQQTGKRWLDPSVTDDSAQMKNLLDAGVQYANDMNIAPGIWLSQEQINNLNEDLVWYVEMVIDGQRVLVPKVYLASTTDAEITDTGALIASGGDLTATVAEFANQGGDVLVAKNAQITASGDIVNESGQIIVEEDLTLTSTLGNVENKTVTITHQNHINIHKDLMHQHGLIQSGRNLQIDAASKINILGATVTATDDITLNANDDVTISAVAQKDKYNYSETSGQTVTGDNTTWHGSNVAAGNDITINSGNDINVEGSVLLSNNDLNLDAGNNVNIANLKDVKDETADIRKKGFMSSSAHVVDEYEETIVSSMLGAGGNVNIRAGEDITIQASDVISNGNIDLEAGTSGSTTADILISSDQSRSYRYEMKQKTGFGSFTDLIKTIGTAPIPGTSGEAEIWSRTTNENTDVSVVNRGSELSAGGNITITAPDNVGVVASTVTADGDVTLDAGTDVVIVSAQDLEQHSSRQEKESIVFEYDFALKDRAELFAGVRTETNSQTFEGSYNARSQITAGNDLNVTAGRDISQISSDIASGRDTTLDAGRDVIIETNHDIEDITSERQMLQSGFLAYGEENVSGAVEALQNYKRNLGSGKGSTTNKAVTALSETLSTIDTITGAVSETVSAGIGFSTSGEKSSSQTHYETTALPTVDVGRDLTITSGEDTVLHGAQVTVGGDASIDAGENLVITSAQDIAAHNDDSASFDAFIGLGASAGAGGAAIGVRGSANIDLSEYDAIAEAQRNAILNVGGSLTTTSGDDTIIAGADITADEIIDMTVGGDLSVISRQDTSSSDGKSFSAGASATVGYGVSVSAHLSNSRTESERAYVDNQTRIVAGDDLNINVGDHTQLDGAILASQEGDVTLDTESFAYSNINDHDYFNQTSTSLSGSGGNSDTSTTNGSIGFSNSSVETKGITRATVASPNGNTTITIRSNPDQDISDLNTDLDKAQETTRHDESAINVYVSSNSLKELTSGFEQTRGAVSELVTKIDNLLNPIKLEIINNQQGLQANLAQQAALLKEQGLSNRDINKILNNPIYQSAMVDFLAAEEISGRAEVISGSDGNSGDGLDITIRPTKHRLIGLSVMDGLVKMDTYIDSLPTEEAATALLAVQVLTGGPLKTLIATAASVAIETVAGAEIDELKQEVSKLALAGILDYSVDNIEYDLSSDPEISASTQSYVDAAGFAVFALLGLKLGGKKGNGGDGTKGGQRPPVNNPTAAQVATAEKLGVDPRWVKSDGTPDWPTKANSGFDGGFDGPPTIKELQPGQTFDRYGGRFDEKGNFTDTGSFVAPKEVPFDQRSLPNSSKNSPYRQYEVLKPIPEVKSGKAAPWFGKPGGGIQHQLPMSIDELVDQGFIKLVN